MIKENIALQNPFVRHIWVARDNGILEVKTWFIYTFIFNGASADKINKFIQAENARFTQKENLPKEEMIKLSELYTNLYTCSSKLPPRLLSFTIAQLNALNTELSYDSNGFLLGDSIGGIAPNKGVKHNGDLQDNIESTDKILFNPGVLARIIIRVNDVDNYIFQLAQKNLKNKGQIFYKPIGGHLKFNNIYLDSIREKFNLELITRDEKQDKADVSLYIPSEKFHSFMNFFDDDILTSKNFQYFENPFISIKRELSEEIGPIYSSDGISLLNDQELDFIYEDRRN